MLEGNIGDVLNMLFEAEQFLDNGQVILKVFKGTSDDIDPVLYIERGDATMAVTVQHYKVYADNICYLINGEMHIIDTKEFTDALILNNLGKCYSFSTITDNLCAAIFTDRVIFIDILTKKIKLNEVVENIGNIHNRVHSWCPWIRHRGLKASLYKHGNYAVLINDRSHDIIKVFHPGSGFSDKTRTADIQISTQGDNYFVRGLNVYTQAEWLEYFNIKEVLPLKKSNNTEYYPIIFKNNVKGKLSTDYTIIKVNNTRIFSIGYDSSEELKLIGKKYGD